MNTRGELWSCDAVGALKLGPRSTLQHKLNITFLNKIIVIIITFWREAESPR